MNIQCFVQKPSFLVNSKFLKQLLNNKMSGLSRAVDNPLVSSIRPKRQATQVHLISLYLYNNAATICFSHHS